MADILDAILAGKRREVATAKRKKPLAAIRAEAESTVLSDPPRDFAGALRARGGGRGRAGRRAPGLGPHSLVRWEGQAGVLS